MTRTTVAALVLGALGALVTASAAVRTGVLWIVDPVSGTLPTAAGVLLAAAVVVGSQTLPPLRGRMFRTAGALGVAAVLLAALVRLSFTLSADAPRGGVPVRYGPGSPPSMSWTLLWWQVANPALGVIAVLLLIAAMLAGILGIARAVGRLRTA